MAAEHRSFTILAAGSRSNSTYTAPPGIQDDDTLTIIISAGADPAVTVTAPTGFSTLSGFPVDMTNPPDTFTTRIYAFGKTALSENGDYVTTHTTAGTEGIMYCYKGTRRVSPFNPNPSVEDHAQSGVGGTILIAPSITPVVNDSGIVWFGYTWDVFGAATPPSGTTPTFTERYNPATGAVYSADGILGTAGATGTKSVTSSQIDTRPWVAGLICQEADPNPSKRVSGDPSLFPKQNMRLGGVA